MSLRRNSTHREWQRTDCQMRHVIVVRKTLENLSRHKARGVEAVVGPECLESVKAKHRA